MNLPLDVLEESMLQVKTDLETVGLSPGTSEGDSDQIRALADAVYAIEIQIAYLSAQLGIVIENLVEK